MSLRQVTLPHPSPPFPAPSSLSPPPPLLSSLSPPHHHSLHPHRLRTPPPTTPPPSNTDRHPCPPPLLSRRPRAALPCPPPYGATRARKLGEQQGRTAGSGGVVEELRGYYPPRSKDMCTSRSYETSATLLRRPEFLPELLRLRQYRKPPASGGGSHISTFCISVTETRFTPGSNFGVGEGGPVCVKSI